MSGRDGTAPRPAGTAAEAARLLRLAARGEGRRVGVGLLLLACSSAALLLQPWPLKLAVDGVLGTAEVPAFVRAAADAIGGPLGLADHPRAALLAALCLGMLLIQVVVGGLAVASHYVLVSAGLRMVFRLRCAVFDHMQRLSLRFHDATPVGDSLFRVTWDTYSVQSLFNSGLVPLVTESLTLVGIAAVMVARDAASALAALAVAIPLILVVRRLDRPMTEHSQRLQERESEVSTRVQETLSGIRLVKAFGREAAESERFRGHADASLRASLRLTVLQSGSQALVGAVLAAGTAAVVWCAGSRALDGRLTPGDVVLLVAYVAMIYRPLETLSHAAVQVQRAAAGARRVLKLLDSEPDVRDAPGAATLVARPAGRVVFEGVRFAYRDGEEVLRGVDLDVAAGSTVAIVGASGAGKTTLASLLLRFYDPDAGRITLDGRDLRDVRLADLRRQIALVPQEPVLFSAGIGENIAYGRLGATPAEVEAAATAAEAHGFIAALADGYETEVGERGVALSVGQRQRISIARAFLKDAPVLVLDEPTSALDAETEAALVEGMHRLAKGRTMIVIAHRLSTIRGADRIVVLREGRVAEEGTHEELLSRNGLYARLHRVQAGGAAVPAGERT